VTVDELETGLSAIAAPVWGKDGVICAIGVSGPTARLQDRIGHIGRLLVERSHDLSQLLGRPSHHLADDIRSQSQTKEGVA
jgi:DNA-binding IclR family transcriptional regulator